MFKLALVVAIIAVVVARPLDVNVQTAGNVREYNINWNITQAA